MQFIGKSKSLPYGNLATAIRIDRMMILLNHARVSDMGDDLARAEKLVRLGSEFAMAQSKSQLTSWISLACENGIEKNLGA